MFVLNICGCEQDGGGGVEGLELLVCQTAEAVGMMGVGVVEGCRC